MGIRERHANFREDTHWQNYHPRGRGHRYHRGGEGEDPGQRGHPPRSAASHLRRQAAGGRPYAAGLQHPEGVDPAPRASPARRTVSKCGCKSHTVSTRIAAVVHEKHHHHLIIGKRSVLLSFMLHHTPSACARQNKASTPRKKKKKKKKKPPKKKKKKKKKK